MNRKQTALLLFLLVVVGIGGLMVYTRQNDVSRSGDPSQGKKLLADFPLNDVAHIALKQDTNDVNLVKKEGAWRVQERNDYAANYQLISEFLLKLRDLKIVQSEFVGPSQLPRLALVPGQGSNAALVVDFKDQNEKPIQKLLLGKKHMQKSSRPTPYGDMGEGWPDGRYVKVGTQSDSVAIISDALATVEPKPDQWLNKDFFKVEKVRSIDVAFPVATNSWKLTRETESGEWKLAEAKPGEQLDSAKTASLSNPLGSPSFNDVETPANAVQLGLDKPTTVTLETFDNFNYTLKVGAKTNDSYSMAMTVTANLPKERAPGKDEKPEDKTKLDKEFKDKQQKLEEKLAQEKPYEKWVYLVSGWTLDPVLKERSQLLVEKKEEPKKEDKPAATGAQTPAPPVGNALSDTNSLPGITSPLPVETNAAPKTGGSQ
jgi:hypothetical protein